MSVWGWLLSGAMAVVVNEFSDISPWAAKQIVHWSASIRYTDRERAEIRAEELEALIESRPGKLFKLRGRFAS